ncbi:hypothetical protein HJFPF1_09600 [Paramyrothecium foliicola]|nr:hypothetical protein HJFPF1_09600 [Paramyrothecium foliicola]
MVQLSYDLGSGRDKRLGRYWKTFDRCTPHNNGAKLLRFSRFGSIWETNNSESYKSNRDIHLTRPPHD